MNPINHVAIIMDGNGRWGLKNKDISEDDEKKFEKVVQTFTNQHIKKIEDKVTFKEKEIMTI